MFDNVLKIMQRKIRTSEYIMAIHAEEEMNDDNLTVFDIEGIIITGEIVERQKDDATGEWKYKIHGKTLSNEGVEVVVKIGPTGKLVIITVFLL